MDTSIYLYGLTVCSTAYLLAGAYPAEDGYGEIAETCRFPGGETGNSALILANLGYRTTIAGPFLGTETRDPILGFYAGHGVDCSELHFDETYRGLEDMILIAEGSRTVFGSFGSYFSGPKRWSPPNEATISRSNWVTIDPFFGEESALCAEMCVRQGKPYVTIDCPPDSNLHRNAAATVLSNEFLSHRFASEDRRSLLCDYADATDGLVVFTSGSREILFKRRPTAIESLAPFQVEVRSTLGAGDVFRAGMVHGLIARLQDREVVAFAAATSACCCRRFPMAYDPPGLEEIQRLTLQ